MKLADMIPGTKLELEITKDYGNKPKSPLISEFELIAGEDRALIAAPILEGVLYPLWIGTQMDIYFLAEQNLYKFKALVIKRGLKDGIDLILIRVISEFVTIQRREFFRFEWSVPVKYRIIPQNSMMEEEQIPFIDSVTKDISGGGVSLAMNRKLELGEILECQLLFKNKKTIHFTGRVVRSMKLDQEVKYNYEIGMVYEKIENADQERIIRYIFEEQRKLRKKGLI